MAVDHTRKLTDGYSTWTQTVDQADQDLTTASSVSLYVEAPDGTQVVSGASVTVVDATTISYQFGSSELSQTGAHKAELQIDYSGTGPIEIVPDGDYYDIQVTQDLS